MLKFFYLFSLGMALTTLTTSCQKTEVNLFIGAFSGNYKILSMAATDYTRVGEGRFKEFASTEVGIAQLNASDTDDAHTLIISPAVADRSRPFEKMRAIGSFYTKKDGYSLFWQPNDTGDKVILKHIASGKFKAINIEVQKLTGKMYEWSYSEKNEIGAVTYSEIWKLEKQ